MRQPEGGAEVRAFPPVSLRSTLGLARSDLVRMARVHNIRPSPLRIVFLLLFPSTVALVLHRFSHLCYRKRLRSLAWLLYLANYYLTGADIAPATSIGHSCLIGHVSGTIISGRLGNNVSLFGSCGVGGGMGEDDVGAGPGLPVIGDNVVVGFRAAILGPIRIGDNCLIGACALVMKDIPAGKVVMGSPARIIGARERSIDYEAVAARGRARAGASAHA